MKEFKTARMRNGNGDRKLYTVYFYNGWYALRGGKIVAYCGDSSYIRTGGNMINIPDFDILNLGGDYRVNNMCDLVKYVDDHERH